MISDRLTITISLFMITVKTKYTSKNSYWIELRNVRTLMLKFGVHPKIVSERLGHSTVAFTLDTYTHVIPGLQEAAAKAFDDTLNFIRTK